MSCETRNHSEKIPVTQASACELQLIYTGYRRTVAGALFTIGGTEPFPLPIASTPNGGPAFAGKSGRRTANACEAKARQTAIATAAHFISGGLIKIENGCKQKLLRDGGN